MAHGYPDFEGDKSSIYSKPQWAAVDATDKNWLISSTDMDYGESITTTYPVPANKTLYITQASFSVYAQLVADADNNQIAIAQIQDLDAPAVLWAMCGNGGGGMPFHKPLVIPAGHRFYASIVARANHPLVIGLMVAGYEV